MPIRARLYPAIHLHLVTTFLFGDLFSGSSLIFLPPPSPSIAQVGATGSQPSELLGAPPSPLNTAFRWHPEVLRSDTVWLHPWPQAAAVQSGGVEAELVVGVQEAG